MTTTALAMAASWPLQADGGVRPVVVEADAAGGDVAARLGRPHSPGLLDVAAAARRSQPGSVLGAARELPFGVRAVLAPSGADQCRQAVRLLEADGERILRGGETEVGTVLVDAGRVADLGQGLVAVADVMVLVTRGGVDALAHVFACREALSRSAARLVLAVVGACPYGEREITQTLGIDRVVMMPWAPRSAAVFSGFSAAPLRTSGWRRSALLAAAERLAAQVRQDTAQPASERAPVDREVAFR
ncbi:hypothetical protein [Streptomyces sp. NBC_01803]|uniref:hypothetical protein n=1 Tax=Streptomyces sp. NBC_01803 TaxID=2975946 RepID=UPI002DDB4971|nr:hypothetical protein [Streptomyces sp. NBC_01803]WSA44212.1 hypothetical protein OIE51_08320 [Streptomyces sp. NBC_01803]